MSAARRRTVVALGGNALLPPGAPPDAETQLRHVREAALGLADTVRSDELVVCHGNGPQVGMLARESALDPDLTAPYPLDALVAQTQGLLGYWIAQELSNASGVPVVCLSTRTLVDLDDPALRRPTKPVGALLDRDEAALAQASGAIVAPDGPGWRRVVPSPEPLAVVEMEAVRALLGTGAAVVCAGGGGVPVARGPGGALHGVEAVVDKDLVAALVAEHLGADLLLVLTDVAAVVAGRGTPTARDLRTLPVEQVLALGLPDGSMRPKVEACVRFVQRTGGRAVIGLVEQVAALVRGQAGTEVVAASRGVAGRSGSSLRTGRP